MLLLLAVLFLHMLLHITHLAANMLGRPVNGNDKIKHQFIQYPAYENVE